MSAEVQKELPDNWEWTKLGDVVTKIIGGGTPSRNKPHYWEGDIPWLTVKDMRSRRPTDAIDHISEKAVEESSTNVIAEDTVIIATRIGLGKVIRVPYKAAINQDLKALVVPSEIDKGYLEYWLVSKTQYLESIGSGTTVKGIRLEQIRDLDFPLAPPEQQKRIVTRIEELFSHIDAGIEALKKAKQLLKQYRQSVLKAAVTGELTKEWREENARSGHAIDWLEHISGLRESLVAERTIGKPKKTAAIDESDLPYQIPKSWKWLRLDDFVLTSVDCPHSTPKYKVQGKKCVRTADFLPGKLVMGNVRYVTPESFDERNKRLVPQPDDVLYSREGGILGIACMIPEGEEVCLGQRMMIFRTESKLASTYLMHNLNSPLIVHRVKSLTGGSASPHLNVGEIRNFLLPIPPKRECEVLLSALDEKLSSIERLEHGMDLQLVKAEKNKQSALASAFSGELH